MCVNEKCDFVTSFSDVSGINLTGLCCEKKKEILVGLL